MPCYQPTVVVPFHPMFVPAQHAPDAPEWLRKHYFVEFLRYSNESKKLTVVVDQVKQVDYESLRFVPFPVFSPAFVEMDQMFTERLKEDLYSSLLINFPVYTPPLFMLLLEQKPLLGHLAREKLRRKAQGLADVQLSAEQVAYEKQLTENPGAQFDATMPILTVYRMYKLFLYMLGSSVMHPDQPLDEDNGSKKFRENVEWVDMLRSSFDTIGRRLDRYRYALFQAVEQVERETGKTGAEAIDSPMTKLPPPPTTETAAATAAVAAVVPDQEMTRAEWFARELKNYSVAVIRALELHLMMLCGVPIRANTTLFMCPSIEPDEKALDPSLHGFCSRFNGGMAQVINERYTERLNNVKPFPKAPAIRVISAPKPPPPAQNEETQAAAAEPTTVAADEEDDAIMAPVDYDIDQAEYARGVFVVLSHHWAERAQKQQQGATAAAPEKPLSKKQLKKKRKQQQRKQQTTNNK